MPRKPNKPFTKRNSNSGNKSFGNKPERFKKSDQSSFDKPKRSFGKSNNNDSEGKSFENKPKRFKKSDSTNFDRPKRNFEKDNRNDSENKPKKFGRTDNASFDKPKRSFGKSNNNDSEGKSFENKPKRFNKPDSTNFDRPKRNFEKDNRNDSENKPRKFGRTDNASFDKPKRSFEKNNNTNPDKKYFKEKTDRFDNPERKSDENTKRFFSEKNEYPRKKFSDYTKKKSSHPIKKQNDDGSIRLNKYIANAGVCSRREADELIKAGVVKVNGKVITELGTKIMPGDDVNYGGQKLSHEKPVYILLNKPKDYLCTAEDPFSRKTVLQLIQGACKERVYPVGRLDRNTTGLLLLTNDGDLTKRLTHPKHGAKKIYQVTTDKTVKPGDLEKMLKGIELEDGPAQADNVSYVKDSKRDIGIEIHMGRNRVIRRMFEALNYKVIKLDRVYFAGLTKKDLQRGKWRFLSTDELNYLKMSIKK